MKRERCSMLTRLVLMSIVILGSVPSAGSAQTSLNTFGLGSAPVDLDVTPDGTKAVVRAGSTNSRAITLGAAGATDSVQISVLGAEVVVQNDSLTNVSSGTPCQCFVPGDRAAAWLTSSCDGNIVAVQVGWKSTVGADPDFTEHSISVLAGGTFPVPGAALTNAGNVPAVITAPTLMDSTLNEYRDLNNASSTPLSVPVTNGQTFVVSLEYLNQNSGTNFPSTIWDADLDCQANKNAVYIVDVEPPEDRWSDACILGVPGDWMIRAVVDCVEADVPAVSEWGMIALLLLILTGGSIVIARSSSASAT